LAIWYRIGRCVLRFTDTVTVINKTEDGWTKTVVDGVQWAEKEEKLNNQGKISIATYVSITFPEGTYEQLLLDPNNEEDAIVRGVVDEDITKISTLLKNHKGGRIKAVNDNSNRLMLKNVKVVVG